jgi:hypothetical protein
VAVGVRGGYRFAVEAKAGLPQRNQAEIKSIHFRSSKVLPPCASAASSFQGKHSPAFGACVEGPTIPNPTTLALKRLRTLFIFREVPRFVAVSPQDRGGSSGTLDRCKLSLNNGFGMLFTQAIGKPWVRLIVHKDLDLAQKDSVQEEML